MCHTVSSRRCLSPSRDLVEGRCCVLLVLPAPWHLRLEWWLVATLGRMRPTLGLQGATPRPVSRRGDVARCTVLTGCRVSCYL